MKFLTQSKVMSNNSIFSERTSTLFATLIQIVFNLILNSLFLIVNSCCSAGGSPRTKFLMHKARCLNSFVYRTPAQILNLIKMSQD